MSIPETGSTSPPRPARGFYIQRILLGMGIMGFALLMMLVGMRYWPLYSGLSVLVCVLFVILPAPRIHGYQVPPLVTAPAAWLACMFLADLVPPAPCTRDAVYDDGGQIIKQVYAYHRAHGRFPETLKAGGIESPKYRCGTFDYDTSGTGKEARFSLTIGDYGAEGFVATWNSEDREWYFDS